MKPSFFLVSTLLVAGCSSLGTPIVELPRPNSGTYSYAEAEARKSEILSLVLTPPDRKWRSDTFVGFAVHLDAADAVLVYSPSLPEQMVDFPLDRAVTLPELRDLLLRYQAHLMGRPATVLVTSEIDPAQSLRFRGVVDLLFQPSVQIVYKRRERQA